MPSFLNKVFGRKTSDDKDQVKPFQDPTSPDNGLLDGKYEAVSALTLTNNTLSKANAGKEYPAFSLFRPKSRVGPQQKRSDALPQLALHLPALKNNTEPLELGVFEVDPESQRIFDNSVIGARLLNPLEALVLVRACAQAITERGLETLGIMHPHWHSASPAIQRKLISLFIHSLTPQSRTTPLSPSPAAAISAFDAELEYVRSPHDVAAVLRWGLRHLVLQNNTFGKDTSAPEWAWYKSFFDAEKEASYPPNSFSTILLPRLPQAHVELLLATIDMISALASHAETNSISGSKLSKFLGLWLLTTTRTERNDDWNTFYARWERAGRILEHLFLARIREESFNSRLPTRLQELVKHYPYASGSASTGEELLSRPRFSTRTCNVLFVRVETLLSESASQPKPSPVHLLLDAFNTSSEGENSEYVGLWNALKTAATEATSKSSEGSAQDGPQFGRVFVDETIQLLASLSPDSIVMSPVLEIASPVPRRSLPFSKILDRSKDKVTNGNSNGNGNGPMTPTSPIVNDWAQFSTSGFGETSATTPLAATLLDADKDVEITEPLVSPRLGKKWGRSRSQQSSGDSPREAGNREPATISTKLASVDMKPVDEAFIDFWSDAITDPITENWPSFVICGLKPLPAAEAVNWLIVERTFVRQQRVQPRTASPERRGRTSPRPSFRSDISGTFAATRKRFSLFGGGSKTSLTGKKGKSPKVGELGEVLSEEEEKEMRTIMARKSIGPGIIAGPTFVGAAAKEAVQLPVIPSETPTPQAEAVEEPGEPTDPTEQESMQTAVEEIVPPTAIDVVSSGETPGPQVALDITEPAAPTPDDSASLPEPVVAVEVPDVPEPASHVEEPTIEAPEAPSSDDLLPVVPVVDVSPELPATPVKQMPLVEDTQAGDETVALEPTEAVPGESPTDDAAISDESPSFADAQDDVDVPQN